VCEQALFGGAPWLAKKANVIQPPLLLFMSECRLQRLRMGRRQHGQRTHPAWMRRGEPPRDQAAPVVSNQMEALCAQLIGESQGVRLEMPRRVGRNVSGPGVRPITALIHSDRPIARCAERGQNLAPTVGEFRPPMQEEDALPVPRSRAESCVRMRRVGRNVSGPGADQLGAKRAPYRFEILEGASHWLPEEPPD